MASEHGRAFPIAWALMKTRTIEAYNVVFKALKDHISDLSPKNIISDYEKAIRASVRQNFPNSKHIGCWFHFSQAIDRQSRKLGITHGEEGGCNVAKRLMATALLPHEVIPQAVQVIEQLVYSTPPAYQTKAIRLLQYFKDEWMRKVTPHAFSVFGQKNRTNNCQETLNRNINRTIVPQGNIWDFWEGLLALSVKEINYHDELSRGLECARPKKNKWLLQDISIARLQKKFVDERITLASFLTCASHRIARVVIPVEDRRGDNAEDVEDVELSSLDVVPGENQEQLLVVEDEGGAMDVEEEEPVDSQLKEYRMKKIFLEVHSILDCTLASFVDKQVEELMLDMEDREENTPSQPPLPECSICLTNTATRMAVPCGHFMGCSQCIVAHLQTPSYYKVGEELELEEIRLPIRCMRCMCLIGKLIRSFL
ncbi:uncharacterized protein LOC111062264 [Nilaparvata lugens]|uniref:uncharacterized protein LOC111062264 n=1 Tax=Nilaparvata lugens TaxID=108931 RepID=UPI00193D947B|nr:uncharacterized protein LOC111062264 [Nilaparvata lugens]